jgi:hypothetical protein
MCVTSVERGSNPQRISAVTSLQRQRRAGGVRATGGEIMLGKGEQWRTAKTRQRKRVSEGLQSHSAQRMAVAAVEDKKGKLWLSRWALSPRCHWLLLAPSKRQCVPGPVTRGSGIFYFWSRPREMPPLACSDEDLQHRSRTRCGEQLPRRRYLDPE